MKEFSPEKNLSFFLILVLFGCSEEQGYRSSMIQRFSDNASGILAIPGISSLSGLITNDAQSASIDEEFDEESSTKKPKEFSKETYQKLDKIIPKKSDEFNTEKGLLKYTIDIASISEKVPGAIGKHLQTLCPNDKHTATVKVREITREGSEESSVSIEVICEGDSLPSFVALTTPDTIKMQWRQKSDTSLLQVFQSATSQQSGTSSKPTLLVRLENNTHSKITDANDTQETQFILQDCSIDPDQETHMQASWNPHTTQPHLATIYMESDDILQQLQSFRKTLAKSATGPWSKHKLHHVASSYGPTSGNPLQPKWAIQNSGLNNNDNDNSGIINSLQHKNTELQEISRRQTKIATFARDLRTMIANTHLAKKDKRDLLSHINQIADASLDLDDSSENRQALTNLTQMLLNRSNKISMRSIGIGKIKVNKQRTDLKSVIVDYIEDIRDNLYG